MSNSKPHCEGEGNGALVSIEQGVARKCKAKKKKKIEWQAEQEKNSKIGEWLALSGTMRELPKLGVNTPPYSFQQVRSS